MNTSGFAFTSHLLFQRDSFNFVSFLKLNHDKDLKWGKCLCFAKQKALF